MPVETQRTTRELVEAAVKASKAKRISQLVWGQSVLSKEALNIGGQEDAIAFDAHTAAAAFTKVLDNLKSKAGVAYRKTHCFVGYGDEVLCVNAPEEQVVMQLVQAANPPEEEEQGGMFAGIARRVKKVVSK